MTSKANMGNPLEKKTSDYPLPEFGLSLIICKPDFNRQSSDVQEIIIKPLSDKKADNKIMSAKSKKNRLKINPEEN